MDSTAARLVPEPEQLGPLRAKVGLFAGARAETDRIAALRAGQLRPLDGITAEEERAAQAYRRSVETQLRADAVAIPRLSARAERVAQRQAVGLRQDLGQ